MRNEGDWKKREGFLGEGKDGVVEEKMRAVVGAAIAMVFVEREKDRKRERGKEGRRRERNSSD